MRNWTLFDHEGRKVGLFTGRDIEADLNTPAGGNKTVGDYDGDLSYFNGTSVVARPVLPIPQSHAIAVDTAWITAGVPEGTQVWTDDELAGTVESDDILDISFPEARVWSLRLDPPFPYLGTTCEVTVT